MYLFIFYLFSLHSSKSCALPVDLCSAYEKKKTLCPFIVLIKLYGPPVGARGVLVVVIVEARMPGSKGK